MDLATVYYLPGFGGSIHTGLGQGLLDRGVAVTGRETTGEFRKLWFPDQVEAVAADLRDHFWYERARVVANSFGAYLFLHAQAQLPRFPGRVLLLSPIVGAFDDAQTQSHFQPPRADRLQTLARKGQLLLPTRLEVHVGEADWQSVPAQVTALFGPLGVNPVLVKGAGHMLGKDYVGTVLDLWLVQ